MPGDSLCWKQKWASGGKLFIIFFGLSSREDYHLTQTVMRKLISSNIRKYELWLSARKTALPWVSLLKERIALHRFIMKLMGLVVWGRKCSSLNGASLAFAKFVVKMYRRDGPSATSLYLKKCSLLLMQSLANNL
jgi:hypothetical protein